MLNDIDLSMDYKPNLLSKMKENSFDVTLTSVFSEGILFNNMKAAVKYIFRDCPVIYTDGRTFRVPLGRNASKNIFMEIHRKKINKIYKRSKSKYRRGNNDVCFNSLRHCKYIRIDVEV